LPLPPREADVHLVAFTDGAPAGRAFMLHLGLDTVRDRTLFWKKMEAGLASRIRHADGHHELL
jgi:hypothetical protein